MDKKEIKTFHAFDLDRDNDIEFNSMTEENVHVPIILRKAIHNRNFKEDGSKLQLSSDNPKRKSKRKNQPSKKIVKYHCYECSTDFENEQLLKVHRVTCNVPTDIESDMEIKQEPQSENESELHSIDQNDKVDKYGKVVRCSMCAKRFKSENGLKGHLRIDHGQNLFTCGICPKSFITKAACNEHVQIHSEQKPYVCDVCGNKYVLRESLTRHYRVHDSKKAYICHDCGKAFAEKISFTRHRTIHTGEKPYTCTVFALKKSVTRHMKIHNKGQRNKVIVAQSSDDYIFNIKDKEKNDIEEDMNECEIDEGDMNECQNDEEYIEDENNGFDGETTMYILNT
ncbi:KRAB [Mytilus coruscus]|uniref:KRAB n=1 Tax=Mytilus coruscus TaxID=42192 RepID=A0A6J8CPX6_MYTCO|nr:KRAB [Mytilus coruscus]